MRKRDKKREKAKAEAAAKKRKEAYVDVVIGEGGKRGAGRRQRVSGSQTRVAYSNRLFCCVVTFYTLRSTLSTH